MQRWLYVKTLNRLCFNVVDATLFQRQDVESTLNRLCFNVVVGELSNVALGELSRKCHCHKTQPSQGAHEVLVKGRSCTLKDWFDGESPKSFVSRDATIVVCVRAKGSVPQAKCQILLHFYQRHHRLRIMSKSLSVKISVNISYTYFL